MAEEIPNKFNEFTDQEIIEPQPLSNEGAKELMAAAAEKKLLSRCSCGATPDKLFIEMIQPGKYGRASGDCCGRWSIEFFLNYDNDKESVSQKATDAWNSAPRAE